MTWGFLWLMLALKLPLAALIYIVWWAIKAEPDETSSTDDDGGIKRTVRIRRSRSRAVPAAGRTAIPRRSRRPGSARCVPGRAPTATDRRRRWHTLCP